MKLHHLADTGWPSAAPQLLHDVGSQELCEELPPPNTSSHARGSPHLYMLLVLFRNCSHKPLQICSQPLWDQKDESEMRDTGAAPWSSSSCGLWIGRLKSKLSLREHGILWLLLAHVCPLLTLPLEALSVLTSESIPPVPAELRNHGGEGLQMLDTKVLGCTGTCMLQPLNVHEEQHYARVPSGASQPSKGETYN